MSEGLSVGQSSSDKKVGFEEEGDNITLRVQQKQQAGNHSSVQQKMNIWCYWTNNTISCFF